MNKIETRGRKKNPNGNIVSNGLFEWQWERIRNDAINEGIDGATKLRQIVNWYYTSKEQIAEREDGTLTHIPNFEKLSKQKPVE